MAEKNLSLQTAKNLSLDVGYDVVGGLLFAIGINVFTAPHNIAPGGISGIAILINYYFPVLYIGTVTMLINVPLLLIAYKVLGRSFTLKTLKSLLISTIMLDIVTVNMTPYGGDKLLACIFGGVLMGLGMGIVFLRGSTTGGADIVGRLLQRKIPHFSMGRLLFLFDCVVLIVSGLVYKSVDNALYGLISIFVCTKMLDTILYGADKGKLVYVVSQHSRAIGKAIIICLDRGGTLLQTKGAYSLEDKEVLLCAVRNSQYPVVKRLVHEIDPEAFMIVTDAGEILGEGFRDITSLQ